MADNEINVYIEFPIAQIERTEKFFQIAQELSDFVAALPLDTQTNDRLIKVMVEQVEESEHGAFIHGLRMGYEFAEYETSHQEEPPEGGANLPS